MASRRTSRKTTSHSKASAKRAPAAKRRSTAAKQPRRAKTPAASRKKTTTTTAKTPAERATTVTKTPAERSTRTTTTVTPPVRVKTSEPTVHEGVEVQPPEAKLLDQPKRSFVPHGKSTDDLREENPGQSLEQILAVEE
jgi:hypothetical protein